MQKIAHSDWKQVWRSNSKIPAWDYLSQVILSVLESEICSFQNKNILEAGSGTGRISLRLAKKGAKVYLMDNELEAITFSGRVFDKAKMPAFFTLASILDMPYASNSFDIVWNAGVIEHFTGDVQKTSVKEMLRVCKKEGLVVTLNPYAKSLLHSIGKFIIERIADYPFADEVPVTTLSVYAPELGCRLKKSEFSVGFIVFIPGMFKRLSLLPVGFIFNPLLEVCNKLFCLLDNSFLRKPLRRIDLWLSRIFGGYLLVTVFEKL